MSNVRDLTPDERLSNIRANEIKANVGTFTSLAGLAAAGLTAAPQIARTKGLKALGARSPKFEEGRKKVASKKKKLDSAATKVFLYGAAPGAAVGLAHAHTSRQDAKAARRRIRSDGSLKPEKDVKKSYAPPSSKPKDVTVKLKRRAKVRQGGLVRRSGGNSTYRRGGVARS